MRRRGGQSQNRRRVSSCAITRREWTRCSQWWLSLSEVDGCKPQRACGDKRLYADVPPPRCFIAAAVDLSVMRAAYRHRELIAHLATERTGLHKTQMVRIRRTPTADQAGLFDDMPDMVAVTNASRCEFGGERLAATTHILCWSCGMYFSAAVSSENDQGSINLASIRSATLDQAVQRCRHPPQRRMPDLALDIGKDLAGVGLIPAPIEVLGCQSELHDQIAR